MKKNAWTINRLNSIKTARLFILAYSAFTFTGCDTGEIADLRSNFTENHMVLAEKDLFIKDAASGKLDYVKALYTCWYSCSLQEHYKAGNLYQSLAAVGDHESVTGSVYSHDCDYDTITRHKLPLSYCPAHASILSALKDHRVVMFTDAPSRVQCRAFFLEMLEDLRKAGFTHLALEGLNTVNTHADYDEHWNCAVEPVYAQIIRRAKTLGFKLVAYEDTTGSKGDTHEKWQAANLYAKIKTGNTPAKTVVLGGYWHTNEDSLPGFRVMAGYFAMISKTNPLTIDQVSLIENSPESRYARYVFNKSYPDKFDEPVLIDRAAMQTLMANNPDTVLVSKFDLYVYHPETEYIFRRPKWLLGKNKELTAVQIPGHSPAVIAQAYLKSEIRSTADYDLRVPVDQAFQLDKGKVYFVLDKASDYSIVFRDKENKIIHTENIAVR